MLKILYPLLLLFSTTICAQEKTVDVILYGGQSNATGQGFIKDISDEFKSDTTVLLYYSRWLNGKGLPETWNPLCPASETPDKFGAELSLGTELHNLYPNKQFAIIKHTLNGSNLYRQWYPGLTKKDTISLGEEFKKFITTAESGIQKLCKAGYQPRIRAMFWQQGENDARDVSGMNNSSAYGENLHKLICRVREHFNCPEMLFIYGYVLPVSLERYPGRKEVREAQHNIDQNSGSQLATFRAFVVETDDLSLRNDNLHFNAEGLIELGKRYARTIHRNW